MEGKVYVIRNSSQVLLVQYHKIGNNTVISLTPAEAKEVATKLNKARR